VVDANTHAQVRHYSGHFAEADLDDLPGGLAGLVSAALHLPRAARPEAVSPAAKAAYESGRSYLRQGRYSYDQAIAQFQQAAVADRHSPLPFAGLADAYMAKYSVEKSRQAQEAARTYLQAGEMLDPDSPWVRTASAGLNIALGRNAQALEDCRRALEIDPSNAEAWLRAGFAYEMQGTFDKALEAYHKAIQLDPGYYKPYQYLGGFYYYQGKVAEAAQQFRKEVEHSVNDLDGFSNLGSMLTELGKYAEAETAFRSAVHMKETPFNLNNLGATLAYLGRDAEALPLYQQAVALQPASHMYWINLGDSQRRLGHAREAIAAYKRALNLTSANLQINPSSGSIRAFKAYAQARLGQKSDAEQEIGQALQAPTNDNQLIRNAILTYEALGNRDMAFKVASRATPEARIALEHHPDLADFRQDSRFKQLMAPSN
jgi:tetratricopeptide (TPR) repeat protein